MIAYSINAENGYAIVSISGHHPINDFVQTAKLLGKHENFYASTHRICDFSASDLTLSSERIVAFVEEAKKLPRENATRTALIGNTKQDRELMKSLASHFDRDLYEIFATGPDALEWILQSELAPVRNPRNKIRIHRLLGDVTAQDVLTLQSSWFNDKGFDKDAPILWDLRKARIQIGTEQLVKLASDMQAYSREHRPDGKAAVLIGTKMHEVMLKSGFDKGIGLGRLRFFWTQDEAYKFLLS